MGLAGSTPLPSPRVGPGRGPHTPTRPVPEDAQCDRGAASRDRWSYGD